MYVTLVYGSFDGPTKKVGMAALRLLSAFVWDLAEKTSLCLMKRDIKAYLHKMQHAGHKSQHKYDG